GVVSRIFLKNVYARARRPQPPRIRIGDATSAPRRTSRAGRYARLRPSRLGGNLALLNPYRSIWDFSARRPHPWCFMTNQATENVTKTAAEICLDFELTRDGRAVLRDDMMPGTFLSLLEQKQLYKDAI